MNPKRILPHLVIAAFTGVVVAGVVVRQAVERDWRAMLTTLEELRAERLGRSDVREALHGATSDDRAWPHYERALAALRSVEVTNDRSHAAARARTEAERKERDALLADVDAMFAHLTRGAQARDARSPVRFEDGASADIQRLAEIRWTSELSVARAMQLLESGDELGAVHGRLDAQQLARDLCVSPVLIEEMIGLSQLVPEATVEWLADGGANDMSASSLGVWLDGLDALRASLPDGSRAMVGEVEMFGREITRQVEASGRLEWKGFLDDASLWRYGFTWRGAAADYVVRGADFAREVERAYVGEPMRVLERLGALEQEAESDLNPIYKVAVPKISSAGRSRIWNLALLDFLRHALALRLARPSDLPVDPFGFGVEVEHDEAGIRVWAKAHERRQHEIEIDLGA